MSQLTEKEQRALEWIDDRDGYYVDWEQFREEFPDVEVPLVGVTCKFGDDGQSLVPIRDVRQGIKYKQAFD